MKKLNERQIETIKGGAFSNQQCTYLGVIAFGFGFAQVWPVAGGALTTAVVGDCFAKW